MCGNYVPGTPSTSQGCAETMMLRDTFSGLTSAGIAMGNFNALDMFVWYGNFVNNYDGLQNTLGAGQFHSFFSNFSGSTHADMSTSNTGSFTGWGNYSNGSAVFFTAANSRAGCNINLQANTILDYTGANGVYVKCNGPVTAIDNVIRSPDASAGPAISLARTKTSILSVSNTFTIPNTIGTSGGELISLLDTAVPRSIVNPSAPTLPPVPPNNSRAITEIAPGTSISTIQTDINSACSSEYGDARPVIHLQAATYASAALTIPANCDVQVIGDGLNTTLTGTGASPVFTLVGPNFATFKDFQCNGERGVCTTMSGIDQVGARRERRRRGAQSI